MNTDNDMMLRYMGLSIDEWKALQEHRLKHWNATDMLKEIVRLRGKVNFYESRIQDMNAVSTRDPS